MTTVAELVGIGPPATAGVPAGFVHTAGVWRHVVEIADPGLGSGVVWHDVTAIDGMFTGYQYGRGSDGYQGRYRASIVNLDFYAHSDALAPWNPDNSATFGVHVNLGPGLLIRSGFILVLDGVVNAWNPRFTCKVESWGDASYSQGKVRIHRVTARDTMSSLVNVPIQARGAENWSTRFLALLADAGWPYGALMYGAQLTSLGDGVLELPDRPAASSAINELDAILDPVGLVWYTNRLGQLIVRPRVEDTFHAAAFAAGATGTPWVDRPATYFAWWAAQGGAPGAYPGADHAAYAVDTPSVDSFGFDETDRWVINHVKVADPFGPGFDDDDPTSIGRYDRKTYQASWLAPNPTVAADMLTLRSYATVEARPLHTNIRLDGFHPGPASVEYLDPVHIVHRNNDVGLEVFGDGWLRSYTEQVGPLGHDTDWSMSFLVDIGVMSARTTELLPVEDLAVYAVTDITATFAWTNPAQTITPTHTQIRLINPSSLWQTVGYPLTGLTWYGLDTETTYEFQVRLLRIVDGLTTHYSPTRSVGFTTDKLHDIDPGCVLEWRLERSVDGADPWFLVDSGVDDEPPYNLPDYDLGSLDPEQWYRWVTNEDCDGVDGPDKVSPPFVADCMGAERLDDPPYDDASLIAYWPEVCPNKIIREAVTDQVMIPGHALAGAEGVPGVASPVLKSGTAGLIGYQIVSTTPLGFQDLTIGCRIMIGTMPGVETRVFEYGGAWISVVPGPSTPDPDEQGIRIKGTVNATGHFEQTVTSTTIFSRDTEYDVLFTHDPGTGVEVLFVDAVVEAAHTFPIGDRIRDQMRMTLPANSWITDCAAWDKILVEPPPPLPDDLEGLIVYLEPAGYWKLDETSGTVALDYSGHARHGTYAGTTALHAIAAPDGKSYPSFEVAKSNWVNIPDHSDYSLGSAKGLTFLVAVKPSDVTGTTHRFFLTKANSTIQYEWAFYHNQPGAGKLSLISYELGSNTVCWVTSSSAVMSTGWQILVGTITNWAPGVTGVGSHKMYRNGPTAIGQVITQQGTNHADDGTSVVRIGGRADLGTSLMFTGGIGQVAIWPDKLDDADIALLMAAAQSDGWF